METQAGEINPTRTGTIPIGWRGRPRTSQIGPRILRKKKRFTKAEKRKRKASNRTMISVLVKPKFIETDFTQAGVAANAVREFMEVPGVHLG